LFFGILGFGMAWIKVYVRKEVEEKFRRMAMMIYGYEGNSLSRAAEDAFLMWMMRHETLLKEVKVPEDPVGAIRGMLANVRKSGVELQHEARKFRATKAISNS